MNIYEEIIREAESIEQELIEIRRDLHRHPETGWLEFRTSLLIAQKLKEYGVDEILTGPDVCAGKSRMGLPSEEVLEAQYQAVLQEVKARGGKAELLERMRGGFTGVVGVIHGRAAEPDKTAESAQTSGPEPTGSDKVARACPVLAIRCDIDALPVYESEEAGHRPAALGFASEVPGIMHACGHDGHTTIGLGTAKVLCQIRQHLHGTVKLLFQPAEEGVRGAKAMVNAGHLDDVDVLLGMHMSGTPETEPAICVNSNYTLATTKMDVTIHGKASHAGTRPDEGKNALLAACTAVQNLLAIPRRRNSITRVNVGKLTAGTGRNVIPDRAFFEMEVRGDSTEANDYMYHAAERVIAGAAAMQGCTWEWEIRGAAGSCPNTPEMLERVLEVCTEKLGLKAERLPDHAAGASEDFAWMGERVREHGGSVCYVRNVSHLPAGIHNGCFDFEECALVNGVKVLAGLTADILA